METPLQVSKPKFDEMAEKVSCMAISEGRNCPVVEYQNRKFVMTGSAGSGRGDGCVKVWGMEVVPLNFYQGDRPPLEYGAHWQEVNAGNRERCYRGMKIKAGGVPVVFIGPEFCFTASVVGEQLAMF